MSLKVSFLPKHIGESELKKAVTNVVQDDVSITVIPVYQQETNYGYINCPNADCAEEIETNLNGLKIAGQRLMVRRQHTKLSSEDVEEESKHQESKVSNARPFTHKSLVTTYQDVT